MRRQRDTFRTLPAVILFYVIILALIPFLFYGQPGYSQSSNRPSVFLEEGEFGSNTNGLIYSDRTIQQLKYIVDSLNLKFRVCELDPEYNSKPQAVGHYIFLDKGKINEAKSAMENNLSFEDFVKKYTPTEVEKNLLIVQFKYKNEEGKPVIDFSSIPVGDQTDQELNFNENLNKFEGPLKGKWVFRYLSSDEYTREGLMGLYFIEEFKQQPLPHKYSRMVQYSDCLVDTTTQIFYEDAKKDRWTNDYKEPAKVTRFLKYVHQETNKPKLRGKKYDTFYKEYTRWDSSRFTIINSVLAQSSLFKSLLSDAVLEALEKGGTNNEFEEYVSLYHSSGAALELKRRRIVVGQCSQDTSPRTHAFNIALLSAETIKWEIFLRAHLDIMNDNFERASDGSYAWGRRKTYIKELESLNINVPDLLFGISLRIDKPSNNHYYGSISRLGRALSESYQAPQLETEMLSMIGDKALDDYNRILLYYLFLNYNYYLENKERQQENIKRLNQTVKSLPEYLVYGATIKNH